MQIGAGADRFARVIKISTGRACDVNAHLCVLQCRPYYMTGVCFRTVHTLLLLWRRLSTCPVLLCLRQGPPNKGLE